MKGEEKVEDCRINMSCVRHSGCTSRGGARLHKESYAAIGLLCYLLIAHHWHNSLQHILRIVTGRFRKWHRLWRIATE